MSVENTHTQLEAVSEGVDEEADEDDDKAPASFGVVLTKQDGALREDLITDDSLLVVQCIVGYMAKPKDLKRRKFNLIIKISLLVKKTKAI